MTLNMQREQKKRRPNRGSSAKMKGSVCFCLESHRCVSSFWNYQFTQAETVTISHDSLFFPCSLWIQPQLSWCNSHLFLCPSLCVFLSHTSCAFLAMFLSWFEWLRWFSHADARPGVFSPSQVALTQEALSFHYPAFPRLHLSQTYVYGNSATQSSPGPGFMNQRNMLQTLHPATRFPGSALAFAHNSVLSSCTT